MRNNKPCKHTYTQSWQGILSNDVNQQMITRVHSQSPKQTWTRIFGNQPSPPRCWLSWWKRVRDWNFQVQPGACKKSGEGEGLKWAMRHGVWPILPRMTLKLSRMSWAHKGKHFHQNGKKQHWMRTALPHDFQFFIFVTECIWKICWWAPVFFPSLNRYHGCVLALWALHSCTMPWGPSKAKKDLVHGREHIVMKGSM